MQRLLRLLELYGLALPRTAWQQIWLGIHIRALRRRYETFDILGGSPPWKAADTRLLAVITHHTGGPYANVHKASKHEKLRACIEGLMASFSHVRELRVVINTVADANVIDSLPGELRDFVEVRIQQPEDPMFLGFLAQPIMFEHADSFDHFFWLEDDIVVEDSMFLEKVIRFNTAAANPSILLSPNRYEFYHGVKNYVDMYNWSRLAPIVLGDFHFKQCANHNAGCWLLNREQLERFEQDGRKSYMKESFLGPLESAGFGHLLESFQVYRPCHPNLHFLEVRHWDLRFYEAYLEWARSRGISHRRPVRWD